MITEENITMEKTFTTEETITTEEFITMLMKREKSLCKEEIGNNFFCELECAVQRGIAEHADIVNANKPMERRTAARIVHDFLLELGEKDEKDWSVAKKLSDLYQCKTCVIHVAQVYAKGIMAEAEGDLFHPEMLLSKVDAQNICERIFDKTARILVIENTAVNFSVISYKELKVLMYNDSKSMLIDVRSTEEYEAGHIHGSISIPIRKIIQNPFIVNDKKNTVIIFYCQRGYQSKLAAQFLVEAGYKNVFVMPYLAP